MRIDHVALWTDDLERLRAFYVEHFDARAGERYENTGRGSRRTSSSSPAVHASS